MLFHKAIALEVELVNFAEYRPLFLSSEVTEKDPVVFGSNDQPEVVLFSNPPLEIKLVVGSPAYDLTSAASKDTTNPLFIIFGPSFDPIFTPYNPNLDLNEL
jgi:hypothetical protein